MKYLLKKTLLITIFLMICHSAWAVNVTLSWDNSPSEIDATLSFSGYYIYYKTGTPGPSYNGTGASQGPSPVDVGLVPSSSTSHSYTLTNLDENLTYFFVVTALGRLVTAPTDPLSESIYSNEVNNSTPSTPTNLRILASLSEVLSDYNIALFQLANEAYDHVTSRAQESEILISAISAIKKSMPEYESKSSFAIARLISNAYELVYNGDDATIILIASL